jgi:predicted RNase H-like nuclease (RuvC/YqgF family)
MKETRKQIIARTRNEISKSYNDRIKDLENRNKNLLNDFVEMSRKNRDLREEVDKLKEKVYQYEDWINRLQEFCDLPEDARKDAIQKYKTEKKLNAQMSQLMNMFDSFRLFNLY